MNHSIQYCRTLSNLGWTEFAIRQSSTPIMMFYISVVTTSPNHKAKGVYPQSNVSLAMIDIAASKRFVDLWVHLSFAFFAIFDLKGQLKLLEMAFD